MVVEIIQISFLFNFTIRVNEYIEIIVSRRREDLFFIIISFKIDPMIRG